MTGTSNSTVGPTDPRLWQRFGSRAGADDRIARSRWGGLEILRAGERVERVVLESPDWVNFLAEGATLDESQDLDAGEDVGARR